MNAQEYSNEYQAIENHLGSFESLVRLFRLQGVRSLINDLYIRIYPGYPFLITIKNGDYVGYISKQGLERTHQEGAELMMSEEAFKEYLHAFAEYAEQTRSMSEAALSKELLSQGDVKEFLDRCVQSMVYYKYTDFHFSDGGYQKAKELGDEAMLERMEELGRFKNTMREYLNDLLIKDTALFEQFVQKIGGQFNVSVASLKEHRYDEVLELLKSGSAADEAIITERVRATAFVHDEGSIVYIQGDEAERLFDSLVEKEDSQKTKIVKGVCASRGHTTGYARVITADYDDFQKLFKLFAEMKQGEILISETTSPDLMPACKKAAAIVTNQGGMVSHAAIVSREFGIPCIVGTRNATKVIKNGDYLEVDADNGIVKILS